MEGTRPFLRWAGSKRKLLPVLADYWPGTGRYVEPFAGSACFFFEVAPEQAVLGDTNAELIAALVAVRDHVDSVVDSLAIWPNSSAQYYALRNMDTARWDSLERAARF